MSVIAIFQHLCAGLEGAQRDLRVGESLDRGSGEVKDVIGEGEIRIGPRPAAQKK